MSEDSNNTEVFVYTEGVFVPMDVVRVRVHPSVTTIPYLAFRQRYKLEEVELCEGLMVIEVQAFYNCYSLKRINIPSTVRTIGGTAFHCSSLESLTLPEGIESIGDYALCTSNFIQMRLPAIMTTIPVGLFSGGQSLFSIEISENINHIGSHALSCEPLRNVAIPMNAEVNVGFYVDVFGQCEDLKQLFGSGTNVLNALKHRFDNLPIHKIIYYHSYNNITSEQLSDATNMRCTQKRSLRIKLDPTGKQRDCLGMTPLHIMACSTVQNLELYKVLVEQYPETLITEDRWGTVPLLYAVWGRAPNEIKRFLIESYQSLYPNHEFDWTKMVVTLGKTRVPNDVVRSLLDIHREFVPDLDCEKWIEELANTIISKKTFGFLLQFGFTERVNAIGLMRYREDLMEE